MDNLDINAALDLLKIPASKRNDLTFDEAIDTLNLLTNDGNPTLYLSNSEIKAHYFTKRPGGILNPT